MDAWRGTISLYRDSQRLAFTDGRSAPQILENADISLISMFHKTIGINLEKRMPCSACFVPKLSLPAYNDPTIQVALFGRDHEGELKGVRWGVFHTSTRQEETFEAGPLKKPNIPALSNRY